MPKHFVQYDLPGEQTELDLAMDAQKLKGAIYAVYKEFRTKSKINPEGATTYRKVYAMLWDTMKANGINYLG